MMLLGGLCMGCGESGSAGTGAAGGDTAGGETTGNGSTDANGGGQGGSAGSTAGAGGDSARAASGGGSIGATDTTGTGGTMAIRCGFVMPNPASTGLPNPASYTTNGDGTVTDNVTGLIWQGTVDSGSYTQAQAATYCASLGGAWRLPTRVELVSLVDFTVFPGLTINQVYFPNTPGAAFWTSSAAAGASDYRWIVAFDSGIASIDTVGSNYNVRCVR
jgi:hypothetical protein